MPLIQYKKSQVNTNQANYNPKTDTWETRYTLPEVTVAGKTQRIQPKKDKPYWITSSTKQLQPSEALAPLGLAGEIIDKVPIVGSAFNRYVAPTLALGNYAAALTDGSINPYHGAELRTHNENLMGAFLPLDFFGPKILKTTGKGIGKGAGKILTSENPNLTKLADRTFSNFADKAEAVEDYGQIQTSGRTSILSPKYLDIYDRFAPKTGKFFVDTDQFQLSPQAKLWRDRLFFTKDYANARQAGQYPLTFAERRQYLNSLKDDLQGARDRLVNRRAKDAVVRNSEDGYTSAQDYKDYTNYMFQNESRTSHLSNEVDPYLHSNLVKGYYYPKKNRIVIQTRKSKSLLPESDKSRLKETGTHESDHFIQEIDPDLEATTQLDKGNWVLNKNHKHYNQFAFLDENRGLWEGSPHELMSTVEQQLENLGGTKSFRDLPSSQKFDIGYYINDRFGLGDMFNTTSNLSILSDLGFFKKGGDIHIKKENRGKFTDYCGGKVTSECIAKGKRSPNSAIRKRATFAANARKWKHQDGGIIKAQEGTKTNWWQKAGNFLNSDAGKGIISGLSSIATTAIQNKKVSSDADIAKSSIDMQTEEQKKQSKMQRRQEGLSLLQNTVDPNNPNANGGIFQDYFLNQYMNQDLQSIEQSGENQKAMIDAQAQQEKSNNWSTSIGNTLQTGLGALGSYLGNKIPTSSSSGSSSIYKINDFFWSNPTYKNYLKGVTN